MKNFLTKKDNSDCHKKDRNKCTTSNAMHYIPSPLCCITALSGLGMILHCVGGQPLVSALFCSSPNCPVFVKNFFITCLHSFYITVNVNYVHVRNVLCFIPIVI